LCPKASEDGMNVLIDVILLTVILVFAIVFFKRGIFGLAIGILRILISILASVLLGRSLSAFIFEEFVSQKLGGTLGAVLSLIISYVLLFLVSFLLSFTLFRGLKSKNIPIISFFDKFGGLIIGLAIGISVASLISTLLYGGITLVSTITNNQEILLVYSESRLFKLIIDVNLFDYIEKTLVIKR
jgi:uncharacterized membrane protein required for colicin V production